MSVQQNMLSMMGSVASLASLGEAPRVPGDVSTSAEIKQWTRQRTQAIKSAKQQILGKTYNFNDPTEVDLAGIALQNKIDEMKKEMK